MTRLWIAVLLCLCGPANGQTVRVTSGEHDGFTRLVFDYGQTVDWKMGRSADGYELQLDQLTPGYDLSETFALIGKSRLAAIWVAPETGQLHIGLACACHAIPFEFRPGIIVVDLKDGPPPTGSSFEAALDGAIVSPLRAQNPSRPKRRPDSQSNPIAPSLTEVGAYDWTVEAFSALRPPESVAVSPQPAAPAPAVLPPDPGLQPLRDTLVHQMARGAAQGVVEMVEPGADPTSIPESSFPSAQIRIGDAPTSVNKMDRSVQGDIGAKGAICVPPESLEIASWGDDTTPLIDQLAASRAGLSGEFDKPDPDAVTRAIRFQLFLGFGAEARQTLLAFDLSEPDAPIWLALSNLIDDTQTVETIFKGQAACNGPSALWAVLGDSGLKKGDPIDTGAVRLAFSALPLHLRRLIGPRLAEKFLALGDEDTARALNDAVTRAPGDAGSAVALSEADIDLHGGDAPQSEQKADAVIADPGPNHPEALVALTEARVAQHLPIAPEVATALQAHLAEHAGTNLEPRLQEAVILAEAASGNFSAAFSGLIDHPQRQNDVWSLLSDLATDDVFLAHAVLATSENTPNLQGDIKARIARRLTGLGLPAPAQKWLAGLADADPILVAETALKNRDGIAALTALINEKGEIAEGLKLSAYEILGDDGQRAEILANLGDPVAAVTAQARAGDWQKVAMSGDNAWKTLAEQLSTTPATAEAGQPNGPLAQGHDLATAGAATRGAIDALLASVPVPQAPVPQVSEIASQVPTN